MRRIKGSNLWAYASFVTWFLTGILLSFPLLMKEKSLFFGWVAGYFTSICLLFLYAILYGFYDQEEDC